jgi:hypothetical protein
MRRVGRPPLGDEPRQLIPIRVDAGVLDQFRKEARRGRVGYQTSSTTFWLGTFARTLRSSDAPRGAPGRSGISADCGERDGGGERAVRKCEPVVRLLAAARRRCRLDPVERRELLVSNGRDGIEASRGSDGDYKCKEGHQGEQRGHRRESRSVAGRHPEQQRSRHSGESERTH